MALVFTRNNCLRLIGRHTAKQQPITDLATLHWFRHTTPRPAVTLMAIAHLNAVTLTSHNQLTDPGLKNRFFSKKAQLSGFFGIFGQARKNW